MTKAEETTAGAHTGRRWVRRLVRLGLLGTALIIATLAYVYFVFGRPPGEGPAGPAVSAEQFQRPWTQRPVMLVGIGDSVTAGLGASSPDLTYFARLIENPDNEFPDMRGRSLSAVIPHLTTNNLAVSGSTSIQHLERLKKLPTHDDEVLGLVVMTTGGNDIIHWYGRSKPRECAMYGAKLAQAKPWIASFQHRLNAMLDLLEQSFPGGCHIFLGDIYDPTDGVGDANSLGMKHWPDGLAIHTAYNDVIHRCCQERASVHLTPLHATFLGHGSHCRQFWRSHYRHDDPHYWFHSNVEDPNDRGYDALRRVFLLEIDRVMNNRMNSEPENSQ